MPKFPVDAPKEKAIKAFELLGFRQVRIREHIAMERENPGRNAPSAGIEKDNARQITHADRRRARALVVMRQISVQELREVIARRT